MDVVLPDRSATGTDDTGVRDDVWPRGPLAMASGVGDDVRSDAAVVVDDGAGVATVVA
jgi:hypothetical protein